MGRHDGLTYHVFNIAGCKQKINIIKICKPLPLGLSSSSMKWFYLNKQSSHTSNPLRDQILKNSNFFQKDYRFFLNTIEEIIISLTCKYVSDKFVFDLGLKATYKFVDEN